MTAVSEAEIRIEINGLRFIGKTQIWEFIDLIIRVYLLKLHTDCHLLPRSIRNQRRYFSLFSELRIRPNPPALARSEFRNIIGPDSETNFFLTN